ncbi:MAG: peptidyl-tRNA hydrolase [Polyangiales bacterium]
MTAIGPTDKLFLITRRDLKPGQQAVQAAHALTEFLMEHPELGRCWRDASNYLALLVVDDESSLHGLARRAVERGVRVAAFHEPDLGDALTAIAIEPAGKRVVAGLPLALQI